MISDITHLFKNYKKKIFFLIFLILSIILGTIFWASINIKLENENQIIGFYSEKNYNPLNDILGYIFFILAPVIFYISWVRVIEKQNIFKIFKKIKIEKSNELIKANNHIYCLILCLFVALEFLSVNFSIDNLDYYHEGQRLSAAYKSLINNSLWSGSYITIGVFYEIIGPKLIWKLFNTETIGLIRFLDLILILITKILMIIMVLLISKLTRYDGILNKIFFIFSSIFLINLIDYNSTPNLIEYREIPILITIILFIYSIQRKELEFLIYPFLGIVSVLVYFWSIDRALIQNIFLILIFLYLLTNKKIIEIFYLLISITISWIIVYLFLDNEFNYFIQNTISILREATLLNGFVHPIPFTNDLFSSRATKTLLSIIFCCILSLRLFYRETHKTSEQKILFIALAAVSFLSYSYALGRNDFYHLKQVFGYPIFFLFIYFVDYFLFLAHKLKSNFLNKPKNIFFLNTILILTITISFIQKVDVKNIFNFEKRLIKYVYLSDGFFITKNDQKFIEFIKQDIPPVNCLNIFSNDIAIFYLLKKTSCSKFYLPATIGSLKNQKKMIVDLQNSNYLIYGGNIDQEIITHKFALTLEKKYSLIDKYIKKNFFEIKEIGYRKILKKL